MLRLRILTSLIVTFVTILIIFFAPWYVFVGISIFLIVSGLLEFYAMMNYRGYPPLVFFGIFSGVILFLVEFFTIYFPEWESDYHLTSLTIFLILFGCFLVVLARFGKVAVISCISTTILGVLYISWMLTFMMKIRYFHNGNGNWYLFFLLLTTKCTDIGAYFVGRAIGKRKLVPAISPKKTIEGSLGGMAAAIIVGLVSYWVYGSYLKPLKIGDILMLSILFGFFSQIGDIIESAIKRDAGIKDSGILLPGMGGILDLVDSVLVTAPLMFFYLLGRVV